MGGEKILKILEKVSEFGGDLMETIEAILTSGYGASLKKIEYNKSKISAKNSEQEEVRRERKRCQNLIYTLEKDGLLKRAKKGGKRFIFKTKKGKEKEKELKEKSRKNFPKKEYKVARSENFSIVIFDVPERERKKRDWVREVLKNMDFKMVQKSVWIGKIKIPKEFINDLFKLKMDKYVEVFEISKTGSLKYLI
ncbi:MAG: CRISPR-associated endonuclease Cas2 [Candidatus Liptonbacteria bacterium RIFOXYB1_FULL_36_10]|uniref:CRISPR-associated endonuclease Cas2 n=2 Tax=Candidatus Liptoniibacteriota TaxID=1817909 RepID=A0A1G2CNC3_9BACT|nr:MAG: CRISPR-associated endonuclease Cas2 [Candidatus Liptonbacteria bacterium RIFOXYB1_FULL_36_10]